MNIVGRAIAIPMAIIALAFGGCDGAVSDKGPEPDAGVAHDRALLDAVQQPLERAHGVDDIAAGRKGELDQEIDAAD